MVSKIIHFCWFGKKEIPLKLQNYIATWHKHMPEYTIMRWDESNFDIEKSCQYVKDAYKTKKYAFVSDFVRLYALYMYGGIYLDTDVQILKPIPSNLLNHNIIFSLDDGGYIAGAFIAAQKQTSFLLKMMKHYESLDFIRQDGTLNMEVNNTYIQNMLLDNGYPYQCRNIMQEFKDDIILYPDDYFHCRSLTSGKLNITPNSYAIHWHTILWASTKTKLINFIRIKILVPVLGVKLYTKLTSKIKNGKTTI